MTINLTSDEKDDILYLTRVNGRAELETYLLNLSHTHQCDPASIIAAAVEDESRNTALHYAAANGHIGEIFYSLCLTFQFTTSLNWGLMAMSAISSSLILFLYVFTVFSHICNIASHNMGKASYVFMISKVAKGINRDKEK